VGGSVVDCQHGIVVMVGGQCGVVLRVLGGLSGGISSGRALQNSDLGSQAEGVGVEAISLQTLVR
jgi:hypothetical protein